jgi:hypothetical protein
MNGQLNVLLRGRASTIARLALYVVSAAPLVVAFTFVSVYGVNVPYLDDWTAVDLFKKVSSGSLAFSDFIADYSGHRILVPRLVFVGLAPLTHWNLVSELYVIQAANVLLFALLIAAARRNVANWMLPLAPFLSFLVFTPRLQETWFFGFHIAWAFVPAFGVLTLYLLELLKTRRRRPALLAGALVAATITTYSLLPGVMIWPAGFVQLLLMRARPWAKRLTIIWTAAGALALGAYFLHWTVGGYRQGLTYNLVHPLKGLDFSTTLLGSSLFYTNRSALIGGILLAFAGVATLALMLRHRRSFESSFWTAVCVFALLMTLEIASGRSGLGAGWAVISRYAVPPRLLVVGLLMLLVTMARVQRSRVSAALAVALAGLLCASAAITYPHVIELAPQARAQREWAAWVLANYRRQPAEFLSVIRYPPGVIAPAEPLRGLRRPLGAATALRSAVARKGICAGRAVLLRDRLRRWHGCGRIAHDRHPAHQPAHRFRLVPRSAGGRRRRWRVRRHRRPSVPCLRQDRATRRPALLRLGDIPLLRIRGAGAAPARWCPTPHRLRGRSEPQRARAFPGDHATELHAG